MAKHGRIDLPSGYHISELEDQFRHRNGLTETKATRVKTRQRCKRCGVPLNSLNPYNFCNPCMEAAETRLLDAWLANGSENMHHSDRVTLRLKALKFLGSTKQRKLAKKTKVRMMLRDKIGGERTPDQWAWGDTA